MASARNSTTQSGIVTNDNDRGRHIPESTRADGSTRKAIKIRPGYQPPEDVEVYKNRTAEAFRGRAKMIGVPGAPQNAGDEEQPKTSAHRKNAKRREARKKAKTASEADSINGEDRNGVACDASSHTTGQQETQSSNTADSNPPAEIEKKVRNVKKKLKQARELKVKQDEGHNMLPEQMTKVERIDELLRELRDLELADKKGPK